MRLRAFACVVSVGMLSGSTTLAQSTTPATEPSRPAVPPPAAQTPSSPSPAATPAASASTPPAITTELVPMEGTAVRGARMTTEFNAPFDVVTRVATDFANYREFLPQVQESRVVQRRRGQQDVYFNVPVLDGFPTMWALLRFDVRRTPTTVVIDGHMVQGNLQRFDFHFEAEEIPGTRRTRAVMTFLGIPSFFLPSSILSMQHARWGGRGMTAMRARCERLAALAVIPTQPASNTSPPNATTQRPGATP